MEAAAFWILAAIIVVLAFRDFLVLLAAAVAITTAISWVYREIERRLQRNEAEMAPVAHLRPALASYPKKTSTHLSWRGRTAA
jgi:hypothetical protein